MNIFSLIVFSLIGISLLALFYLLIKSNFQKRKILAFYIQAEMDKHFLSQKLEELSNELSTLKLSESDGFVKFISQSRDWAFEYIEQVQKALVEFDEEVAPRLEWATTYGNLAGETIHTETITKISEAYKKLKSVLPENTKTPNN
jgi:heme exporter protein D